MKFLNPYMFIKESLSFMEGYPKWKVYLYMPVAYIKYLYYSLLKNRFSKSIFIILLFVSYHASAQQIVTIYDKPYVDSLYKITQNQLQAKSDSITLLFLSFNSLGSLQSIRDSLAKHTNDINSIKQSIQPLKDSLIKHTGDINTLKQSFQPLKDSLTKHTSDISILKGSFQPLKDSLTKHTLDINSLKINIQPLKDSIAKQRIDINSVKLSIQPLKDSLSKHTVDINNLKLSIPKQDTIWFKNMHGTGKQISPLSPIPY